MRISLRALACGLSNRSARGAQCWYGDSVARAPVLASPRSSPAANFRILTDDLEIQDGYVINFGVFFDVVAHKFANKNEVKLFFTDSGKSIEFPRRRPL